MLMDTEQWLHPTPKVTVVAKISELADLPGCIALPQLTANRVLTRPASQVAAARLPSRSTRRCKFLP
jgi:hypothetical protein